VLKSTVDQSAVLGAVSVIDELDLCAVALFDGVFDRDAITSAIVVALPLENLANYWMI